LPVELATALVGLPATYFGALHLGLVEPTKANADLLLTSIAFSMIVFAAAEGQCLVIASRLKRSTSASTDLEKTWGQAFNLYPQQAHARTPGRGRLAASSP
jgi:hypothetical protein